MANLIITVEEGQLKGLTQNDIKGGTFLSFLGIPFAKPPIAELRFKDPEPAEKWVGIRDATKEGNVSLVPVVVGPSAENVSEDCLFLNVFTKNLQTGKPVMVFVHGGGFTTGSASPSSIGPEFLLTEDIVLVTIQYRLGALGFLSFNDPSLGVPGNAGLKDQVQALKWIQKNIEAFGGDPNNVTIFGESAGSASVHFLILSPLAKGLFHKAILQSGTVLNPWTRGTNDPRVLAKTLGFNEIDEKSILEFLQKVPGEKIIEAQLKLGDHIKASKIRHFSPSVERKSENAFISEDPAELLHKGQYNKVPIMIGYCSLEGLAKSLLDAVGLPTDNENFLPHYFGYEKSSRRYIETNKKVVDFYFKNSAIDDKDALHTVLTDTLFLRGIYVALRSHAKSEHPVYFYRFSLDAGLNMLKKMGNLQGEGAAHADDLGYLFKNQLLQLNPGSIEETYVHRFVKLWTNFAKTGNPTPVEDPLLKVQWRAATENQINFLDIGSELVPGTDPDIERMKFWDALTHPVTELY